MGGGTTGAPGQSMGQRGTNQQGNAYLGSGATGGNAGGSAGQGGVGQGQQGQGQQGQGQQSQNPNANLRGRVEQQQRAAGVSAPPEHERRQLEDLNALSRQLTPPGTPVPAPHVEGAPRGR